MPAVVSKHDGHELDAISDAVDNGVYLLRRSSARDATYRPLSTVNVLKGKIWDSQSAFDSTKDKTTFRQYENACDRVKNFYKEQHGWFQHPIHDAVLIRLPHAEKQTVEFNIKARVEFKSRKRARMGIWQAMQMLNTLKDDSDPDVSDSLACDLPWLTCKTYLD